MKRTIAASLGVRGQLMLAMVTVFLSTATILFFSLSALQIRDEKDRLKREALVFSQFATERAVTDFTKYFYFSYENQYLPAVEELKSRDENLVSIRIISGKSGLVLFDSEQAFQGAPTEPKSAELPERVYQEIAARGYADAESPAAGEDIGYITTYRRGDDPTTFLVEWKYGFRSLARSLARLRGQILLDLLPSAAIALLIAWLFARALARPIRGLVLSLGRVTRGDYSVEVAHGGRNDEIGELLKAFNQMTRELRAREELKKYLSTSTYRSVVEQGQGSALSQGRGQRVQAAILFADIRDFVHLCESLSAEEVTGFLNEYFTAMVEVIHRHGGEVDKFIGDAVLAVFHDCEDSGTDRAGARGPLDAVFCALELRGALQVFNERRVASGKNPIEIGVGITYGPVVSGPVGSPSRRDFTVIGDIVNLASRIEKLSKGGRHTKVVLSGQVEAAVRGLLDCERMPDEVIRGKDEPVAVYELVRVRTLESIVANLLSAEVALRTRSAEILGYTRNREAITPLLKCLQDPSELVRIAAASSIARLAREGGPQLLQAFDQRPVGALLALARDPSSSSKLVSACVGAAGQLAQGTRVLELAEFLDSEDSRIASNAVEALGRARLRESTELLVPKLASPNNRLRANAALALVACGRYEAAQILKPMLLSGDPKMRASGAFALGEVATLVDAERLAGEWKSGDLSVRALLGEIQAAVPLLVALLSDRDLSVKRQAVVALGKLKDRAAVLPLIASVAPDADSAEILRDVHAALHAIGAHQLVRDVTAKLASRSRSA